MSLSLGIDVGTSSVKVTVVAAKGIIQSKASQSYCFEEPQPDWKEISPEVWWEATRNALHQLSITCDLSEIISIGVTGQMHTPVLLTKDGVPACNSIMWNDLRTKELVSSAKQAMEKAGEHNIAKILSTGSPAINLYWVRLNQPHVFSKIAHLISVPDWIVYKLTGVLGTDYSFASTSSLYSIEKKQWSEDALSYFGIPCSLLPTIEGSAISVGKILDSAASLTKLPKGISVIRGLGDNPASALSAGCLGRGNSMPAISLGTSGVFMYSHEGIYIPQSGKTVLYSRDGKDIQSLIQLSIQSCGNDIDWIVKRILGLRSFKFEDSAVEDIAYNMRKLMFFPHLNGEKTLFADPDIRGCFLGLDLSTTRSELYRAVMEGISFGFKQIMDATEISDNWTSIAIVGGGSKSGLWTEIIANVLGKTIYCLDNVSAGQGSALLASQVVSNRIFELPAEPHVLRKVVPQVSIQKSYTKKYHQYLRIKAALDTVYSDN
ncbi:xylulokinase [uncultured Olegusella sp.]|uniref:xylulokinase n=1 Tax=uncultured Olegusella sp. TaxID=1979846 RepID=UPI00263565EE|nr:FGGY family carbohydrate kinase [uncultured Olegusella sp.]